MASIKITEKVKLKDGTYQREYEAIDLAIFGELLTLIHNVEYSGLGKPRHIANVGKTKIETRPGDNWPSVIVTLNGSLDAVMYFDLEIESFIKRS